MSRVLLPAKISTPKTVPSPFPFPVRVCGKGSKKESRFLCCTRQSLSWVMPVGWGAFATPVISRSYVVATLDY